MTRFVPGSVVRRKTDHTDVKVVQMVSQNQFTFDAFGQTKVYRVHDYEHVTPGMHVIVPFDGEHRVYDGQMCVFSGSLNSCLSAQQQLTAANWNTMHDGVPRFWKDALLGKPTKDHTWQNDPVEEVRQWLLNHARALSNWHGDDYFHPMPDDYIEQAEKLKKS